MKIEDQEISLRSGSWRAVVSPWGAALRRLYLEDEKGEVQDIAWGYSGLAAKKGGQGDVLIPFPNRIKGGQYTFEGTVHQLEKNDKDAPNAIHGLLRMRAWTVGEVNKSSARFLFELRKDEFAALGYPFSLTVEVHYALSKTGGLTCSFKITNSGDQAAPVGVGFHPYFKVGTAETINSCELKLPATSHLVLTPELIPTGAEPRLAETHLDFQEFKKIGAVKLNHCFSRLKKSADGRVRSQLRDPKSGHVTTLWMDGVFQYLVVYTGDALGDDARRGLAIEPMTCSPDAFNFPKRGLRILKPGEVFEGSFGVSSSE